MLATNPKLLTSIGLSYYLISTTNHMAKHTTLLQRNEAEGQENYRGPWSKIKTNPWHHSPQQLLFLGFCNHTNWAID